MSYVCVRICLPVCTLDLFRCGVHCLVCDGGGGGDCGGLRSRSRARELRLLSRPSRPLLTVHGSRCGCWVCAARAARPTAAGTLARRSPCAAEASRARPPRTAPAGRTSRESLGRERDRPRSKARQDKIKARQAALIGAGDAAMRCARVTVHAATNGETSFRGPWCVWDWLG